MSVQFKHAICHMRIFVTYHIKLIWSRRKHKWNIIKTTISNTHTFILRNSQQNWELYTEYKNPAMRVVRTCRACFRACRGCCKTWWACLKTCRQTLPLAWTRIDHGDLRSSITHNTCYPWKIAPTTRKKERWAWKITVNQCFFS